MKPALFINDLQKGGAERLVKDIATELANEESVSPIVVVGNPTGELLKEFKESAVPLYSLDVEITPRGLPVAARRLAKLLEDLDVDLVHSHLAFSHVVSRIACARSSIEHISTYHNVRSHKSLPKRITERVTEPLTNQCVCVSEGVRQTFPDGEDMEVIYNAIAVEEFNKRVAIADRPNVITELDDDTFVLLNVARCVEQKRQEDLVEAMAHLDSDAVHLFIVGDGPRRQYIEDVVKERDLEDSVTVTGYVEAVEPYYAIADAFVSSSENEGLPTTHIEASAAGLPIASTNIPGVTEVVSEGETGSLSPVDSPRKMAETIKSIREGDPQKMGKSGLKKVQNEFSIGSIVADHLRLYQDVCYGISSTD